MKRFFFFDNTNKALIQVSANDWEKAWDWMELNFHKEDFFELTGDPWQYLFNADSFQAFLA